MDVLSEALTSVRMTGAHPHPLIESPQPLCHASPWAPTVTTIQAITMSVNT